MQDVLRAEKEPILRGDLRELVKKSNDDKSLFQTDFYQTIQKGLSRLYKKNL